MTLRFALNHMVAPQLDLRSFFQLARDVGVTDVEIRNDIAGKAIIDGTSAATVRALAEEAGVTILTINALQRFNRWRCQRHGGVARAVSAWWFCRGRQGLRGRCGGCARERGRFRRASSPQPIAGHRG